MQSANRIVIFEDNVVYVTQLVLPPREEPVLLISTRTTKYLNHDRSLKYILLYKELFLYLVVSRAMPCSTTCFKNGSAFVRMKLWKYEISGQ